MPARHLPPDPSPAYLLHVAADLARTPAVHELRTRAATGDAGSRPAPDRTLVARGPGHDAWLVRLPEGGRVPLAGSVVYVVAGDVDTVSRPQAASPCHLVSGDAAIVGDDEDAVATDGPAAFLHVTAPSPRRSTWPHPAGRGQGRSLVALGGSRR